jgi:hypothetical protein
VAAPPEDDTVGGVRQRHDGAGPEQHSTPVTGTIDIEHGSTVRLDWMSSKVQIAFIYGYQTCGYQID